MANRGGEVFNYFRQRGLSPAAAAGIVGNTQQESGSDPNAPGGGLIQGQGGRTHAGSLRQQLEGVWRELQGPERGTLGALRGAKTPAEAARIFSQRFERPGIPMLSNRERYALNALRSYGGKGGQSFSNAPIEGGSAGTPATMIPGSRPSLQGGVQRSPAQIEDLLNLVDELSKPSAPSVEGQYVAKPSSEPQTGPKLPASLPAESKANPADLLALIDKIGQDAGGEPLSLAAGSPPQLVPGTEGGTDSEGYVNPLPGFKRGRTDQGVDYSGKPGQPIRTIGPAKVIGISPNWYQGQPYVSYELTAGPQKGKIIYVAEQITPTVKAGDILPAGGRLGVYAPSGTGLETGYGSSTPGQTLARAEGNTGGPGHANAPAGIRVRRLLESLGA